MDNQETILQQNAIICNLNIPCWTGRIKLPEMDSKFKRDHGIDTHVELSSTFVKLLGSGTNLLDELRSISKKARAVHQKFVICTMGSNAQYSDKLISVHAMGKVTRALEDLKADWDGRLADFLNSYEQLRSDAIVEYQGVLSADHFLTVEQVALKFGWSMDIRPLPNSNAFDNKLGSREAEEEIKKSTINSFKETHNKGLEKLFTKTKEFIQNINNQSKGIKGIADSTLDNFAEFLSILPDLNIFGDKTIAKAYEDAKQLLKYDASATTDQSVKDELADKSQSILDDLNQFYGGK